MLSFALAGIFAAVGASAEIEPFMGNIGGAIGRISWPIKSRWRSECAEICEYVAECVGGVQ